VERRVTLRSLRVKRIRGSGNANRATPGPFRAGRLMAS
jgi:hypothetical protein